MVVVVGGGGESGSQPIRFCFVKRWRPKREEIVPVGKEGRKEGGREGRREGRDGKKV